MIVPELSIASEPVDIALRQGKVVEVLRTQHL